MTEEWGEPVDWDALWKKERELKAPVENEYTRNVAPLRRRRAEGIALVEREYSEKVRSAKSRLATAQREFRETMLTLKRWRDAATRAIENECAAEIRPWAADKKSQLAPIQEWKTRQWKRLNDAGVHP